MKSEIDDQYTGLLAHTAQAYAKRIAKSSLVTGGAPPVANPTETSVKTKPKARKGKATSEPM